ncbi:hypothetical protein ACFWBX_38340 [Streptomyces sp. NPDC059991]|uniref:hypothetical protein n=1 Tax=Streptomyces sp. NPDC059991 TaxID=3347028 RepID=UPI00367E406B
MVLSYDADGDGLLDTYRRITGVAAPVLLRLSRGPAAFVHRRLLDGRRGEPGRAGGR